MVIRAGMQAAACNFSQVQTGLPRLRLLLVLPDSTDIFMTKTAKLLYTARTHTSGGRLDGVARSSDGRLDVRLSPPGGAGIGTNPEQLIAAGWSACFEDALALAARRRTIVLPRKCAIDAEIDLILEDEAYALRARLFVSLPGLDPDIARDLIEEAHRTCPYSKAISNTVEVSVTLI
jgi:Ohr subfamily peroxiredoxin